MENVTAEQLEGYKTAKASVNAVLRRLENEPSTPRMKIYREVGADFDLSESMIRKRLLNWEKQGDAALVPKVKGRKKEDGKFLSDEREAEIIKLISDKTPDQMKMPFALWSRQAVQELIYSRYGIHLVVTAVGKYLKKWGLPRYSWIRPGKPGGVEGHRDGRGCRV